MEPQLPDHTPPSAFQVSVARTPEEQKSNDLPPALVEAIRDDPATMQPIARVYAATVMHEMFKESGAYTPAQKKDFVELCTKIGDMQPRKEQVQAAGGPGYQLIINLGDTTETHRSITVDQKPLEVADASV